jgi:hypothetical protein
MSSKPRCDTCLNRVPDCICERTHKVVKVYLHSSKDSLWWEAENEHGLEGEIARDFAYMLYEVEFTIIFNLKTGEYEILEVRDGKQCLKPV